MCRLLAYVAPAPTRISDVIGDGQCETFQRMGRLHDDGWGSMWVDEAGPERLLVRQRDPATAFGDVRLHTALHEEPPVRARAFHLRLATGALAIDRSNTHPFLRDGIGLAHNGSIFPSDRLRRLLIPEALAGVEGTTDSELYHALVWQEAAAGVPLGHAVARAVARLRAAYPSASLNAIVMNAEQMVVVHASSIASVPYEHFATCGLAPHELPADHDESYYRIGMLRSADGAIAFSPSGLDRSGWVALPDDSMTVVDIDTAQVRTHLVRDLLAA